MVGPSLGAGGKIDAPYKRRNSTAVSSLLSTARVMLAKSAVFSVLLLPVDVVGKVELLSVVVVVPPPVVDEPLLSVVVEGVDEPLLSVVPPPPVVDEPLLSVVVDEPPPLDDPESAALLSEEVDPVDDESLLSED